MKRLCALLSVMVVSVPWLRLYAASPAGIWEGQLTMMGGRGEMRRAVRLELAATGSKLTGRLTGEGTNDEVLDGIINGDEVSFAIASGASDVPRFEFHGRLDGDMLTITVTGRVKDTGRSLKLGEGLFKRRK